VGFIRKLPHHLIASFRSTLEEAREADVLLHVIDSSHPDRDSQRRVVRRVLDDLGLKQRPRVLVFNKIDLLGSDDLLALRKRATAPGSPRALFTSAVTPTTLKPLGDELRARIRARMQQVSIEIPAWEGKTLATLYEQGEVLSRRQEGTTVRIVARAPPALIGRLRARHGVRVTQDGQR
jgi:GTP-binding protein HflX